MTLQQNVINEPMNKFLEILKNKIAAKNIFKYAIPLHHSWPLTYVAFILDLKRSLDEVG